jgi:serine/threonine-protein kinase RsbW
VLLARLVVSQVGRLAGFGPEEVYDLKLAVTEAATNVIRHAAVEHYEIEYRVLPRAVEITVIDSGGGFNVADLTRAPDGQGGFGLAVIRDLVDELMLDSTEGGGTRLKMIRRASEGPDG